MNKPQIIFDSSGRPAFAVIEWSDFQRLTEEDADAWFSNEGIYDRAMAEGGESFPIEVADRLVGGESPVKTYRNHRGLSQIENGRRVGSTKTLAALAAELNVTLDGLTRAGIS